MVLLVVLFEGTKGKYGKVTGYPVPFSFRIKLLLIGVLTYVNEIIEVFELIYIIHRLS